MDAVKTIVISDLTFPELPSGWKWWNPMGDRYCFNLRDKEGLWVGVVAYQFDPLAQVTERRKRRRWRVGRRRSFDGRLEQT